TDVLQLDVTALATLLPRISSPTLTTADVNAMDPADLLAVGQEVQVFFLPKAQREADFPTA
ncbi:phage tail protein, partial [Xanthomonas arboricola pv. corylina]